MKVMIYDTGIGLIPFLRKIIEKKKCNEYYLYMDEDVFPIGSKPPEFILSHLKFILEYADKKFDILILACNSLSSYLDKIDLKKYKVRVYSIFAENIKLLDDETTFIGTSASTINIKDYPILAVDSLPTLIESSNIAMIISLIQKLPINTPKAILGCTHFPFIKFIFEDLRPDVRFISNESAIINKLPSGQILTINGNKKAKKYLYEYLKKSNKILC